MSPSLSLLIPVFNAEHTIADQLHRLLEVLPELTQRFEITIIDDGSRDHTPEIVTELSREYPQIRLLRSENRRGFPAAVEWAKKRASGDCVIAQTGGLPVALGELRRLWKSQISPAVPTKKQASLALRKDLLEGLSAWGEALRNIPSPAVVTTIEPLRAEMEPAMPEKSPIPRPKNTDSPRRPGNFLAHLRDLAMGE